MKEGPELVIGLVGAIGTDLASVSESLQRQLTGVGYTSSEIRVSHLFHEVEPYSNLAAIQDREAYYEQHMNAGNDLCERLGRTDATALLAILQVRDLRNERNTSLELDGRAPLRRHAFIINSLKRPDEIKTLRKVYGDAFVLLGAYSSREGRRDTLAGRIAKSQNKDASDCRHIAERLITRDESEPITYGQDVNRTFFQADAFIDATEKRRADESVRRFVDVVFGSPFETPTRDELGMQYAFVAALRSADVSRQVGAALCSEDGQVLAVGTNEVPKAGGGFHWAGEYDRRDFRFGEDEPNAEMKRLIMSDIVDRVRKELIAGLEPLREDENEPLRENGLEPLRENEKLSDSVRDRFLNNVMGNIETSMQDSRLKDITEYGRTVHAEMAAITDAARRGVSVSGAILFSTTFPCHNCAKHIVAAGIRELIYIEPYLKSQVARLFSDSIALERVPSERQVPFSPFVGFAPLRLVDFFWMRKRRDDDRHILNWEVIRSTAEPLLSGIPAAYLDIEKVKIVELKKAMANAGMAFRTGGEA